MKSSHTVDLNVDAGESYGAWKLGDDLQVFRSVTSVNLACGGHASDPLTMSVSVEAAVRHGLSIGAHPGYPDLAGFGRRHLAMSGPDLFSSVLYQLGALSAFTRLHGTTIRHVKAHGALYLQMMVDGETADTVAAAVAAFDSAVPVVVLAGEGGALMRAAADRHGLRTLQEAFPDRSYLPSGQLAPRSHPDSLVLDPELVAERAADMVLRRVVRALDGSEVPVQADTLCIHGDNQAAPAIAAAVRRALEDAGVHVRPPTPDR